MSDPSRQHAETVDIRSAALSDPRYPSRLSDLPDPPARLWLAGAEPSTPAVAIVGTRRADPGALRFARSLAEGLARAGVGVLSGGAEGIDAAAHRGALDGHGRTWVVHAPPLGSPYPRRNRPLFDEILARGGGWMSETPPGQPAYRARFLARNRLVAALADLVVVVQAPARSGALSTARHAVRLGRPLLVVPASPWDPRGEGGVRLLREVRVGVCLDARDVTERLGLEPPPAAAANATRNTTRSAAAEVELPGEPALLLKHLSSHPRHVDELAEQTGLSAARVQVALVRLASAGLVTRRGGGWRRESA